MFTSTNVLVPSRQLVELPPPRTDSTILQNVFRKCKEGPHPPAEEVK
jgi:hypothetical protein